MTWSTVDADAYVPDGAHLVGSIGSKDLVDRARKPDLVRDLLALHAAVVSET